MLDAASLMVAAPAAADAVARARRLPRLQVGLHVVAIEGPAVLAPALIPDLVDARGWFPSAQVALGWRYAFRPRLRAQLAAEIAAQFAAFAATGLPLAHADAHKHMHLHPFVGRLVIAEGRRRGLPRLRIPAEPPAVIAACGTRVGVGDRALFRWSGRLRRVACRAGIAVTDHCFGLAWSGAMTAARLLRLAQVLPPGSSELYLHPAVAHTGQLTRLMPGYDHTGEFAALIDPEVVRVYAGWRSGGVGPHDRGAKTRAIATIPLEMLTSLRQTGRDTPREQGS